MLVVACAEPAVIQYKQVCTQLFALMRNVYNLFSCKAEACSLPVVYKYGTALLHEFASAGIFSENIV